MMSMRPRIGEDGRLLYLGGENCPGAWHCHVYQERRPGRDSLCSTLDWRKYVTSDHSADPVAEQGIGGLTCSVCGVPVRTWAGGRFPVHTMIG